MSDKASVLREVYDVIVDRRANPKEGSYTNYLFDKGLDKICKKVGEGAGRSHHRRQEQLRFRIRYEISDLLYHMMVLMVDQGVTWGQVFTELEGRRWAPPCASAAGWAKGVLAASP